MELEDFVLDGTVQAAASVFPVNLTRRGAGISPARFMLIKSPNSDEWWAAAWISSRTGKPERLFLHKVVDVYEITVYRIDLSLDPGDGSGLYRVVSMPSSGGCCGNRLKGWNPFGAGVQMTHLPYTSVS